MQASYKINVSDIKREDNYRIFTIIIEDKDETLEYKIYVFDHDLPIKSEISNDSLKNFAREQMAQWLMDNEGKLPKDKYRVLVNGGKITTDNIESFLSVQKKPSDLIRTNVTISASLFEWAKAKAYKESTSFSDLVSRGLITLKDSDKEIEIWFKEQGSYFRKELKDYGSFELIHYLPNNYSEYDQSELKNALQVSEQRRTGWPIGVYLNNGEEKPHPQSDGVKAKYSSSEDLALDYWYAKNKGEFYFSRNLESDSARGVADPNTCLYFDTLIWRVAESLDHCIDYYKALGVSEKERIKIKISLYGLKNRHLSAWNRMRSFTLNHYTSGSEKSSWEIETSLEELTTKLDDIILDSVKKLLVMFDFFVPAKEVVMDILNNEYRKSRM